MRHLVCTLVLAIFPFMFLFFVSGPSFGTYLLTMLYLPCEYLIAAIAAFYSILTGKRIEIPVIFVLYLLYCTAAAGVMLLFDRRLGKKEDGIPEQSPARTEIRDGVAKSGKNAQSN